MISVGQCSLTLSYDCLHCYIVFNHIMTNHCMTYTSFDFFFSCFKFQLYVTVNSCNPLSICPSFEGSFYPSFCFFCLEISLTLVKHPFCYSILRPHDCVLWHEKLFLHKLYISLKDGLFYHEFDKHLSKTI